MPRRVAKSSTTSAIPRISSDSTIFSSTRTKNGSTTSIYEATPFNPSALGATSGLYMQSSANSQSTTSFASSIAPSSFQPSSYGQNVGFSLPNSPESTTTRTRSLTSNIVTDKGSRRTRILLTPGRSSTSESSKAAAATSMNDTNAQGTIELPPNERSVQDVIAGSGVDMPQPNLPPWQSQMEGAYGKHLRDGRGSEVFTSRVLTHAVGKGYYSGSFYVFHEELDATY